MNKPVGFIGLVGEILTNSIFACLVYKIYARLLAEGKFEPAGFSLELGFKDTRLLQTIAKNSSVPMPISDLLYEKLSMYMSRGNGKKDWSCIASLCTEEASLNSDKPKKI